MRRFGLRAVEKSGMRNPGQICSRQSGAARKGDELEVLGGNCQLAPGGRALL